MPNTRLQLRFARVAAASGPLSALAHRLLAREGMRPSPMLVAAAMLLPLVQPSLAGAAAKPARFSKATAVPGAVAIVNERITTFGGDHVLSALPIQVEGSEQDVGVGPGTKLVVAERPHRRAYGQNLRGANKVHVRVVGGKHDKLEGDVWWMTFLRSTSVSSP